MSQSASLVFPALGALYGAVTPWLEALLRAAAGLAFVPHGMRMALGFFPNTGGRGSTVGQLAMGLERGGYKPGKFWAWAIVLTQFIGGPCLAFGLFTRPAAAACGLFMLVAAYDHAKVDGYFWNTCGLEYPLMWALAALVFVGLGGGVVSLDHVLLGWEF